MRWHWGKNKCREAFRCGRWRWEEVKKKNLGGEFNRIGDKLDFTIYLVMLLDGLLPRNVYAHR